jgi:hypothetical protein
LPDLHQSLFGRIMMIFIVTLFAAYLSMSINAFGGQRLTELKASCQAIAFVIQVSILPTFWRKAQMHR